LKRTNTRVLNKEVGMTSIADSSVKIQTTSESNFSTPAWFGEVVVIRRYLHTHGVLSKITEHVRFARKRFGHYEVIDFLAVLFGYAISGERTLEAFYERLQPFAVPFMALFGRDRLPSRSALSRFLAALTEVPVEALRTLFLDDFGNVPYPRQKSFLRLFAGWMTSAPLATGAANAERLSEHAQRCPRRIVISGSAVSETEATDAIGRNCARGLGPLAGI
jgi:hypothetical protein